MRCGTQTFNEEEIAALVARYVASRDVAVRNRVVVELTPLVESAARRFAGYAEPLDDLVSEGFIGLIHALEHFDASRGVKFSTYASHFIIGQIKHYLRDHGKTIREPAWLQQVSRRIVAATEQLQQELGRQPSSEEVGARANLTAESVAEILVHRQVFQIVPMETGDSDDDDSFVSVNLDKIKSQRYVSLCLPIEDRIVLERLMGRLREMERHAIRLFFYQDFSQTEIARKLGISCNYAGHLIRTGLQKLRRFIQTEELREARLTANRPGESRLIVVDRLTSLYTAAYFHARLEEEIARAQYYRRNLAVIAVAVELPPSLGRSPCDALLTECGIAIRQCLRRADIPARTGENEFAAILPHTSYQAALVSQRLGGLLARITNTAVTCGAALWPQQGDGAAELWEAARASARAGAAARFPAPQPGDSLTSGRARADNSEWTTGEAVGEQGKRRRPAAAAVRKS